MALEEALSRLHHPDRDERAEAAAAVTEALRPGLRTRAYVFNTLLQDKAVKDRLRSYPHWLASRNLANEASDESVEALIEAVQSRYELAGAGTASRRGCSGSTGSRTGTAWRPWASRTSASPTGRRARSCSTATPSSPPSSARRRASSSRDGYIDAPPRPGKRGGAFCSYTVPSAHPYVMLNYTSRPDDVLTMAHELGHGVHAALARPQGIFQFTTPLTLAETASIFGETIVLERLLERAPDAAARLDLLAGALDGAVAAVFRQIAMNRFEDSFTRERRERGELATDRFGELWLESQSELLGDSVELSDDYGLWWSYVPHFVDTPGYVYAYPYGHLLALSVYRRYEEAGAGSCRPTSTCCEPAARCPRRSWAPSSAWTSPIPASGPPAST